MPQIEAAVHLANHHVALCVHVVDILGVTAMNDQIKVDQESEDNDDNTTDLDEEEECL